MDTDGDDGYHQAPIKPKWGIVSSMLVDQQLRIQELEEQINSLTDAGEAGVE